MGSQKDEMDTVTVLQMLCEEQWSNSACSGYAILAGQKLRFTQSQIDDFMTALKLVYEQFTVDEAKQIYRDN